MRVDVVGRNTEVPPDLHQLANKRFAKVSRQVPDTTRLQLVVREEANPAISAPFVAEATLHLKGKTLHAEEACPDIEGAVRAVAKDIGRQVKRQGELQRKRSRTRQLVGRMRRGEA